MAPIHHRIISFLFTPPPFPDEQENRIAHVIYRIAPTLVLSAAINFASTLVVPYNFHRYLYLLLATLVLALLMILSIRAGYVRHSARMLIILGWLVTTATCYTGGGLKAPVFLLYAIIALGAGLLMGMFSFLLTIAATVAMASTIAWMDSWGYLPPPMNLMTPFSLLVNLISVLLLVWVTQYIFIHSLNTALGDSTREINFRKKAEEEVTQHRQLLTSVLDSTQDMIVAVNREYQIIAINAPLRARMTQIYGIQPSIGMPLDAILPPHRQEAVQAIRQLVLAGEQIVVESQSVPEKGNLRYFEESYTPIFSPKGSVEGFTIYIRDITDRKSSDEALRQSEFRFRKLFEDSADATLLMEGDRFIDCNQAALKMLGMESSDQIRNMLPSQISPPTQSDGQPSEEKAKAMIEQAFQKGSHMFEWEHLRTNGEVFTAEVLLTPIDYQKLKFLHVVWRDITERKRTERLQQAVYRIAQAEGEATSLDLLFNKIHQIVGQVMPADNFYISLYDEGQSLISFPYYVDQRDKPSPPRKLGKGLTEHVLRYRKPLLCTALDKRKLVEQGAIQPVGSPSAVWLGAPLLIEGRVYGVIALQHYSDPKAYDSTDLQMLDYVSGQVAKAIHRKKSAEEIAEAMNYIQTIYAFTPLGIITFHESGRTVSANEAVAKVAGMTLDQLKLQNYQEMGLWKKSGIAQAVNQGFALESEQSGEFIFPSDHGKPLVMFVRMAPFRFHGEKHLLGVMVDISDHKRLEEERLELERQLLHTQKLESLGVLAGGIAHDFNNLLTAIIGNLDMAVTRFPSANTLTSIERAQHATRRASDLSRQMLAYSGKGHVVIAAVDLNHLVQDNIELLCSSISRHIILQSTLLPDLPLIEGDPAQLQQVVMNLITNGSEAIGEKTGIVSIITGVKDCNETYLALSRIEVKPAPGRYIFLDVIDTGCGMTPEVQARIFEPFFTTKFTGRGLGMSAVLGIVKGHRGAIILDSQEGCGTSIRILLPAASIQRQEIPMPAESPQPLSTEPTMAGGTVLIVDDEEIIRELAGDFVRELGWQPIFAENGEEAIHIFRDRWGGISCVLLDLTMPKMGGVETFEKLREIDPKVRVLISSGYNERDVLEQFSISGIKGFIQKPYRLDLLRKKIQEALR